MERFLVNSKLLVVTLWGSQKLYMDFDCTGGQHSNPCVVQVSNVLYFRRQMGNAYEVKKMFTIDDASMSLLNFTPAQKHVSTIV